MCQRCGYKWSAQQDDLFYYKKRKQGQHQTT